MIKDFLELILSINFKGINMKLRKKSINIFISLFLFNQQIYASSEIVLDSKNTSGHTTLDKAANGLDVINIAKPDKNGISHNKYIKFNVPNKGIILNNSKNTVKTKLAGYIYGNKNVKNAQADLILNEVTSSNRSYINGYIEVAGKSSDVIIANPNGITVNGGGFINIPKATLTSGKVSFEGKTPVFTVKSGDILINNNGLDASESNTLNIYTKALKINAAIWAKKLNVITGENKIKNNIATKIGDSDDKFSIDSSSLGGIYANEIKLIGTSKGVGVNLPPEVLAQDNLEITNDGEIIIKNAKAKNSVKIVSKNGFVKIEKRFYAKNAVIKAKKDIEISGSSGVSDKFELRGDNLKNKGLISGGVNEKFENTNGGKVNLNFKNKIENEGIIYANSLLNLNSVSLINKKGAYLIGGKIIANENNFNNKGRINGSSIKINSNFTLNSGLIHSDSNLSINGLNLDNINGKIEALKSINFNIEGNVSNINGMILSNENLNIKAHNLKSDNSTIQVGGDINISLSNAFENNNSFIYSDKNIFINSKIFNQDNNSTLQSLGDIYISNEKTDNKRSVIAANNVKINSNQIDNQKGIIEAVKNIILVFENLYMKNSSVMANDSVFFKGKSLNIYGGEIYALHNLNINVNKILNQDSKMESEGDFFVNAKFIKDKNNSISAKNLKINAYEYEAKNELIKSEQQIIFDIINSLLISDSQLLTNSLIKLITKSIDVENTTLYSANDKLNIDSDNADIKNSSLIAKNINLDISKFLSQNSLYDGDKININSNFFTFVNKNYFVGSMAEINASYFNNNKSSLFFDVNKTSVFINNFNNIHGLITSNRDLIIKSKLSDVSYGSIKSAGNLKLDLHNVNILNSQFIAGNFLSLNTDLKTIDSKTSIISLGDMSLNFQGNLINNGILGSNGFLKLSAKQVITNNVINSMGAFNLNADTFENRNMIVVGSDSQIILKNNFYNKGFIISTGNLKINASKIVNSASIASENNLYINSNDLENNNMIYSGHNMNLFVNDDLKNNTNANIYAGGNILIAKNANREKSNKIENLLAEINSGGSLEIYAKKVNNIGKSDVEYETVYHNNLTDKDVTDEEMSKWIKDRTFSHKWKSRTGSRFNKVNNWLKSKGLYEKVVKEYGHAPNKRGGSVSWSEFSLRVINHSSTNPSVISSDSDMKIVADELINKDATISSGNNLQLYVNKLDNNPTEKLIDNWQVSHRISWKWKDRTFPHKNYTYLYSVYTKENKGKIKVGGNSLILAGNKITGNINKALNGIKENQKLKNLTRISISISNEKIDRKISSDNKIIDKKELNKKLTQKNKFKKVKIEKIASKPVYYDTSKDIVLPKDQYGLFVVNKNPKGPLIERNPKYTNYNYFVNSSYMLKHLHYNPGTLRMLGDAMYETKLISNAVIELTSQRYIQGATNDNEQYLILMDNAISVASELNLEIGKPLTKQQIKKLKKNIVWLVKKKINGIEVLVPVLYLANKYNKPSGALISAKNIDLKIEGNLTNGGNINALETLRLRAGALNNYKGNINSLGLIDIKSIGDIKNLSGSIKGSTILLESEKGDIVNKRLSYKRFLNKNLSTHLNKKAVISASSGNIFINAKKSFKNKGGDVNAKNSLFIKAKDVEISAIKSENSHNNLSWYKDKSIKHIRSSLKAGNILAIKAANNINLQAAKLKAKNVILDAGNINSLTVTDSKYKFSKSKSHGIMSHSTTIDASLEQKVIGTSISGDIVALNAKKNINLEAADIDAKKAVSISSKKGDVNLISKEYVTKTTLHMKKSSVLGVFKSKKSNFKKILKQKGANVNADTQITLNGKNINISGSGLKAQNGNIFISAKKDLNVMDVIESTAVKKIKERRSLSFKVKDNKIIYSNETKDSQKITKETSKASELVAKSININTTGNTNIIASNIKAGVLNVNTKGDFNVLSDNLHTFSKQTHSNKDIGVQTTVNTKEVSVFSGYWEDRVGKKEASSNVAKSNVLAREMNINSKNTNIKGSALIGENIAINSDNIRVMDSSSDAKIDSYIRHIKFGVRAGVKQHLSDTVNSFKSISKANGRSSKASQSAKAYDALTAFSSTPASAGVEAVFEYSGTSNEEKNSQSVGSSLMAFNHLVLNAKNKLQIKGSDVGSKDRLDINAKTMEMYAGKNSYSSDTKTQSGSVSVELYGSKTGNTDINYAQSHTSVKGVKYRNSRLYAGGFGNINVDGNVILKGANIDVSKLKMKMGGNLYMKSMQNTQTIKGNSFSISVSTSGERMNGGGVSKGSQYGKRAWVDEVTSINGRKSADIVVGGKTTLIGAAITSIDNGKDTHKLNFKTGSLKVQNIKGIDKFKSSNIGIGYEKDNGINSFDYANSKKSKVQITRATISNGRIIIGNNYADNKIKVNRDINLIQNITKNKKRDSEVYLSQNTVSLVENPKEQLHKLKENMDDVGLALHREIIENLPSAKKGEDSEGDLIDNTIGLILDKLGDVVPLGIVPSSKTEGGFVTQLAIQLFGDNRAGILTHDKRKFEVLGLKEKKPGDKVTDWDYEKVTLVKTKEGIKPISEVKDPSGLEVITLYRTNPNKKLVIEDGEDRSGNPALERYKIRVKADEIKKLGINHLFTNGMFNNYDTAVWNQQTQQGKADGILNYNQQHGILGDLIECIQDHLTVNGLDMAREIITVGKAKGAVDGVSFLGTGGSKQTGELISQMTRLTNGNLVIAAHSQGTMMTENGLDRYQEQISQIVQNNKKSHFIVEYNGAPVNHVIGENKVREIYGGDGGIEEHIKNASINNVFRSNVTPGDFVGSVLGYQGAGINNSKHLLKAMMEGFKSIPRLFGIGDPSPHSYYPCVIGCGNENFIPDIGKYYTPNKLDEKGKSQSSIKDYYKKNFEVTRPDGKKEMTIDMSLLPQYEDDKSILKFKDKR